MLLRSDGHADLRWAPITHHDLGDLSALLTAIDENDRPGERHSLAQLYESFEAADADPARDSLLARDPSGILVAYGWNHPNRGDTSSRRVDLHGGVHPRHRGRGAGHALLRWQLEESRQWYRRTYEPEHGPLQVVAYVDEGLEDQRNLFEKLGLQPIRWYVDMTYRFDLPPQNRALPAHVVPPGIRLVPLNRKRLESVRVAHNEAFADHWGTQPVSAARWEEQMLRSASRLSWSWVALVEATSEVVAYVTNAAHEPDWDEQGFSEGWSDRIGVRRAWRGQGIGRALLTASMRSFVDAGLDAAGLGVDSDNPSRDLPLYEQLGYRSTHTVVMYARTEEPDRPD